MSLQEPFVFFPGTLCDERIFMPVWQELNLANKAFVPLQWAEDLQQMLALSQDRLSYFEQDVHLVGYSMGGYIAALIAIEAFKKQNNKKSAVNIASLTLLNSSGKALGDDEVAQRKSVTKLIRSKQYRGMPETKAISMLHPKNQHNAELINAIVTMSNDLGANTLLAQTQATAARKNLIGDLAKLPIPIHFIAGDADVIAPCGEIVKETKLHSNMSATVIKDTGHMLPLEQPKSLAAAIGAHL